MSATILDFDTLRTRPGLRDLMLLARHHISVSRNSAWLDGEQITPEKLLSFAPSADVLFRHSEDRVAEDARKLSLLALAAIQSGTWMTPLGVGFFMEIQARSVNLRDRLCCVSS